MSVDVNGPILSFITPKPTPIFFDRIGLLNDAVWVVGDPSKPDHCDL